MISDSDANPPGVYSSPLEMPIAPLLQSTRRELPHPLDLVLVGGSVRHRHHQTTKRSLSDERADVQGNPLLTKTGESLGKTIGRIRVSVHSQELGRHSLPNLALGLGIDQELVLAVGVDVDEAGAHDETVDVETPRGTRSCELADRSNPVAPDSYVGATRG